MIVWSRIGFGVAVLSSLVVAPLTYGVAQASTSPDREQNPAKSRQSAGHVLVQDPPVTVIMLESSWTPVRPSKAQETPKTARRHAKKTWACTEPRLLTTSTWQTARVCQYI